jgi:NAD-dependent dihydropyrimidine dehydrogenase PreA subunit
MVEIIVDRGRCTGCGKCREVCPKGPRIWRIGEVEGKRIASVLEEEACLYCTLCVTRCPTDAIKIKLHS